MRTCRSISCAKPSPSLSFPAGAGTPLEAGIATLQPGSTALHETRRHKA